VFENISPQHNLNSSMDQIPNPQEEIHRLRKAVEELSTLNELARVISSTTSVENIIENIVKRSLRSVHAQQGMITLVDEQAPDEMKTLVRTIDSSTIQQQYHLTQNIVGWMMIHKAPLLVNDLKKDARFSGVRGDENIRSLLCVPLIVKSRLIGVLTVCNKKDNETFSEDDQRLLTIIAMQSAQVLENARLYEQEKSLFSIQEEIKLAAKIQLELLPKRNPVLPEYEIAGKTIPAQLVGGDYFDFVPIDEKRLAIILGDVSGKGLPASLLMANLQATLRGQAIASASVDGCICRANKLLFDSTSPEKFATLFYAVLDTESHTLTYCNAGHEPPFVLAGDNGISRLEKGGLVLGILEHAQYEAEQISLNPGDLLLIYSDGISEAMNLGREEFAEKNIEQAVYANRTRSAEQVIDTLVESVTSHMKGAKQWDDMTLLVVKRKP
jgi:phosphoserine phosphatase RsbU/P